MHLLVSLLIAIAPWGPAASNDSVVVEVAGRTTVVSAADLAALPRDTVQWSYHGTPHAYAGVRLIVLLRRAGVPIDSLKGADLTKRVVVEAADRYRAVFTLAEIAPGLGGRMVLLADEEDGHPLTAAIGPWRLVVPADGSGARGVRQVTALRVLDEPPAAMVTAAASDSLRGRLDTRSAQGLPPDSLFARLIGRWVLRGTIARQQTVHDVSFEWMLGREYVRMHEISRERKPDGSPAYEAVVLFGRDPQTGAYACQWMDNTAAGAFDPQGIGRGSVAGDSVPFLFHYTATTSFHTTFVYERSADAWQWHMDNDSAGVRRPFARVTLTRR